MTNNHKIILDAISEALSKNPELRFGQVLFNLRINEFQNPENPEATDFKIRDIHNDSDVEIIDRIKIQKGWFSFQEKVNAACQQLRITGIVGMTVNERLSTTGLMDDFDKYKKSNKKYAEFILQALSVDIPSINKILK